MVYKAAKVKAVQRTLPLFPPHFKISLNKKNGKWFSSAGWCVREPHSSPESGTAPLTDEIDGIKLKNHENKSILTHINWQTSLDSRLFSNWFIKWEIEVLKIDNVNIKSLINHLIDALRYFNLSFVYSSSGCKLAHMILIFELEWSLRQRQEDNYMVGRLGYYIVVVVF